MCLFNSQYYFGKCKGEYLLLDKDSCNLTLLNRNYFGIPYNHLNNLSILSPLSPNFFVSYLSKLFSLFTMFCLLIFRYHYR